MKGAGEVCDEGLYLEVEVEKKFVRLEIYLELSPIRRAYQGPPEPTTTNSCSHSIKFCSRVAMFFSYINTTLCLTRAIRSSNNETLKLSDFC